MTDTIASTISPRRPTLSCLLSDEAADLRLLVCGGRDYADRDRLAFVLGYAHRKRRIALLIHGGAQGADALAAEWAKDSKIPVCTYRAEWDDLSQPDAIIRRRRDGRKYDARAGHRRNQYMLTDAQPDLVLAFQGGSGTDDMVNRARAAGVPVFEVGGTHVADVARDHDSGHPVRIQYERGERMRSPNGLTCAYVGRPTPFGNPYKVGQGNTLTRAEAVDAFRKHILARPHLMAHVRAKLRGKNLACWCACDGEPCHADVLLAIANS